MAAYIGALSVFEGKSFNVATLVVATLALIVGICGAYFAWRTVAPRRRLTLEMLPPASLINETSPVRDLQLTHQGAGLTHPYVISLTLKNSGRAAIGSDQFDSGRPIVIDLGAPIVSVLSISSAAGSRSDFAHEIADRSISLGPDLLKPNEAVAMQVLVDGHPLSGVKVSEYLRDATLEYLPPGRPALSAAARQRRRRANVLTAAAAVVVLLLGAGVVIGTYVFDSLDPAIRLREPVAAGGAASVVGTEFFPWVEVEFGVVTAQQADAVQDSKDLGSALATDRPGTDGLVAATLTVPRSAGNLLIFARQGPRATFVEVG